MKVSWILTFTGSAALTAVSLFGLSNLDQRLSKNATLEQNTRWAEWVTGQVEVWAKPRVDEGQSKPISRTIKSLRFSNEDHFKVLALTAETTDALDEASKDFWVYKKVIFPKAEETGVVIQVRQPERFFWGVKTQNAEVTIFSVIAAIFFGVYWFLLSYELKQFLNRRFKRKITTWVQTTKSEFNNMGTLILELARTIKSALEEVSTSKQTLSRLSDEMNENISLIKTTQKLLKESSDAAKTAESSALNIALEAKRLGGDNQRIIEMAEKIIVVSQDVKRLCSESEGMVNQVERKMVPCSERITNTCNEFKEILHSNLNVHEKIQATRENMTAHKNLLSDLDVHVSFKSKTAKAS